MLKFSGLLCFLLLAVVSAAGEESCPARERGTEPFPFQERFQKEFRELFEMLAKEYPQYALEKHKGYPTKLHYELLDRYGVAPIYRKSFLKKRGYI